MSTQQSAPASSIPDRSNTCTNLVRHLVQAEMVSQGQETHMNTDFLFYTKLPAKKLAIASKNRLALLTLFSKEAATERT